MRLFHCAAELTLVTSTVMRDALQQNKMTGSDEDLDVWKKGICCETFHPRFASAEARRRLLAGRSEGPLLLSVGRLGWEKNLHSLKAIVDAIPGCRLAFVGDGPARSSLEAHFAGAPVAFLGLLQGEALAAAYASADVFVMPSESETLGFVVLEAMASGTPVVAVRAGGIPDIITRPGETGILYEPGDVQAATAGVKRLLEDASFRERVARAAREEVSLWDWRAATQYLLREQYPVAMAANARRRAQAGG